MFKQNIIFSGVFLFFLLINVAGSDLSVLTSVLLPIECLIWMDVNMNMNNEENNIKFCGLVEQHRVLYDHTMSDYHNRNVSDRAWAKIAQILKTTGAIKGHCNKEEDLLHRCSMALPVLSSPEISFALTREELDKSCIELRAGIKCIDNYTEICMEKNERAMFRQIYAGITSVVQELCTRGSYQDEYLRHAVCVKNVRPEYETCSKKYEVTLTTLSHQQKNDQYTTGSESSQEEHLRIVCCSFQEYLLCSERTVQRACGDEAAQFTSAFLKRMATNIIKNFCFEYKGQECGLSSSSANIYPTSYKLLLGVASFLTTHLASTLVPT